MPFDPAEQRLHRKPVVADTLRGRRVPEHSVHDRAIHAKSSLEHRVFTVGEPPLTWCALTPLGLTEFAHADALNLRDHLVKRVVSLCVEQASDVEFQRVFGKVKSFEVGLGRFLLGV